MKKIRQDRIAVPFKLEVSCDGKLHKMIDFSQSGLAFVSETEIKGDQNLEIFFENTSICKIEMSWVRSNKFENNYICCFEAKKTSVPTAKIKAIPHACNTLEELKKKNEFNSIPNDFKIFVYEFKSFISALEIELDKHIGEINDSDQLLSEKEDYVNSYLEFIADEVSNKIEWAVEYVKNFSDGENKKIYKELCSFFRSNLKNVYKAPIAKRFLKKPLGYAGDFEMMNQIYHYSPLASKPIQKVFDLISTRHPHAISVRNRIEYLKSKIEQSAKEKDEINVLSVASGPAEEIKNFVKHTDQKTLDSIKFNLLDQDLISLQYAQSNIQKAALSQNLCPNIEFYNLGVKSIARGKIDKKFDLIYSAGLFDYLPDAFATHTAKQLFDILNPGGRLIIGNFDFDSNNCVSMSLLFDWELIYRSPESLKGLFSSIDENVYIEKEVSHVNLFAVLEKR